MRRTIHLSLIAALALTAVAAGDAAEHPCYDADLDEVVYNEEGVFFHASDTHIAAPDDTVGWDTTAPASSVAAGEGGIAVSAAGSADSLAEGAAQSVTFEGAFSGCIDVLAFDVYSFDFTNRGGTSGEATPADHNFGISVTVDDVPLFSGGPLVANTTHVNEGIGGNLNQWSIGVGALMESFQDWYPELMLDGDHAITIELTSWFANTGNSAYVWDTTEVPSGMTFNPAVLDEAYNSIG